MLPISNAYSSSSTYSLSSSISIVPIFLVQTLCPSPSFFPYGAQMEIIMAAEEEGKKHIREEREGGGEEGRKLSS